MMGSDRVVYISCTLCLRRQGDGWLEMNEMIQAGLDEKPPRLKCSTIRDATGEIAPIWGYMTPTILKSVVRTL